MRRMTLDEAKRVDSLIRDLAFYDVTEGMMLPSIGPDDKEEITKLQTDVLKRFNVFKKLIQNGEFTLKELEYDVVSKYSAIPKKEYSLNEVDDLVEEYEKADKSEDDIVGSNYLSNALASMFSAGGTGARTGDGLDSSNGLWGPIKFELPPEDLLDPPNDVSTDDEDEESDDECETN